MGMVSLVMTTESLMRGEAAGQLVPASSWRRSWTAGYLLAGDVLRRAAAALPVLRLGWPADPRLRSRPCLGRQRSRQRPVRGGRGLGSRPPSGRRAGEGCLAPARDGSARKQELHGHAQAVLARRIRDARRAASRRQACSHDCAKAPPREPRVLPICRCRRIGPSDFPGMQAMLGCPARSRQIPGPRLRNWTAAKTKPAENQDGAFQSGSLTFSRSAATFSGGCRKVQAAAGRFSMPRRLRGRPRPARRPGRATTSRARGRGPGR
jgi:hypothetical protein